MKKKKKKKKQVVTIVVLNGYHCSFFYYQSIFFLNCFHFPNTVTLVLSLTSWQIKTPRIKELQNDIQQNAEAIDQIQSEMQAQFRRAETTNTERFHLLNEALDALLLKQSSSLESSHGAANSSKQPFQVCGETRFSEI